MKKTVLDFYKMKKDGAKISMVTAYDFPMAQLVQRAGVDCILVGDSLGMVVLGYDSTVRVTMEDMLHHTRPVARAIKNALLVTDMPFGSYQISVEQALANAIRLIKEGGASAVKLEGGEESIPVISALSKQGIPVMAHIGLLPQTANMWQGFRYQGRDIESAHRLLETAKQLEQAGAFALVLECVAAEAAAKITSSLKIPTIGIGSGLNCDGQVLVFHDLAGLNEGHVPRFVKQYGEASVVIRKAIVDFAAEVRAGVYPDAEHSFFMDTDELKRL